MVNEWLILCMRSTPGEMKESPDFQAQLSPGTPQVHPVEKRIMTGMAQI
jgi:hypothetical protein